MTSTAYETVVDVLTEAFVDDPVIGWLFPDEGDRRRLQPPFYRSLVSHPTAEVLLSGNGAGAAVWLLPDAGQSPYDDEGGGADPEAVFGVNAARLLALGRLLAERHPLGHRHLYLACMGVLPACQGSGLGSSMLRDRLARADTERLPAYLEASSYGSRALYLRHGFEPLGEPIRLPDGPPLWPMWRQPKPTKSLAE